MISTQHIIRVIRAGCGGSSEPWGGGSGGEARERFSEAMTE